MDIYFVEITGVGNLSDRQPPFTQGMLSGGEMRSLFTQRSFYNNIPKKAIDFLGQLHNLYSILRRGLLPLFPLAEGLGLPFCLPLIPRT